MSASSSSSSSEAHLKSGMGGAISQNLNTSMFALNVIERVAIYLGITWAVLAVLVVRIACRASWTWTCAVLVVAEGAWLLYGYSLRWEGNSGVRAIPGPPPRLFSGHYDRLVDDFGNFYREAWRAYAHPEPTQGLGGGRGQGVFKLFFGRTPRVVLTEMDMISKVANSEFPIYDGRPGAVFRARQISMLLNIRGPLWHRIRSAMVPAFSQQNLKGIYGHLLHASGRLRDEMYRVKAGEEKIDLVAMWSTMSVEAIGLLAFGTDLRSKSDKPPGVVSADGGVEVINEHPIVTAAKHVLPLLKFAINDTAVVMSAFPFLKPLMRVWGDRINKRSLELWAKLDATTLAIVAARKADPEWHLKNDLLTRILEAKDADGKPLKDFEVLDQVNTFLIAGYETTSTTLGFASLLLAQNPDKQQALMDELDRLAPLHGGASGSEPDLDDLMEYTYTEAVVKEAMRLYTPAVMTRSPNADTQIRTKDGTVYPLTAGTMVHLSAAVVHFDERVFADPFAFRPERWLADDAENMTRHKHAHMAFGFGPRGCIGMRLAMAETKLALIQMYRHFTFRLHRDTVWPPQIVPGVTHVPKHPLYATVHPRRPRNPATAPAAAAAVHAKVDH